MHNRLAGLQLARRLPVLGVLGFSLCSVWSVYHLFTDQAEHPTALYILPAILVELVAAWSIAQSVRAAREVTRSNISRQDRRFYGLVLVAFLAVALPLLAVSVYANAREFGSIGLGLIFPVGSVGCAVGAALPGAIEGHRKRRERERQEKDAARNARRQEKDATRQLEEARRQVLGTAAAATLEHYRACPDVTQGEAAEALGVSVRTVRNHLRRLEAVGLIGSNGNPKPR